MAGVRWCLVVFALLIWNGCSSFGGSANGSRLAMMEASPQWDLEEEIFVNSVPTGGIKDGKKWETFWGFINKPDDAFPEKYPKTIKPSFPQLPATAFRVTWLGHSTMVIRMGGKTFLLDPMFSERASPFSWAGPQRFHAPVVSLRDLPPIDAVIISHDHYDHLDMVTIETLVKTTDAPFLMPLGVGAHFEEWEVPADRIIEMDWWDEAMVGSVKIAATPSRHFSGRGLFDRNETLWASWTFVGPTHRVFFSGDTGFFDGFREISEKYGPFDIAMFEIGAFHENWADIHLGPDKAIEAFEMMDAKVVMPIHWGTFSLGMHGWRDPIRTFSELAESRGHRWVAPRPGDYVEPGIYEPQVPWWE